MLCISSLKIKAKVLSKIIYTVIWKATYAITFKEKMASVSYFCISDLEGYFINRQCITLPIHRTCLSLLCTKMLLNTYLICYWLVIRTRFAKYNYSRFALASHSVKFLHFTGCTAIRTLAVTGGLWYCPKGGWYFISCTKGICVPLGIWVWRKQLRILIGMKCERSRRESNRNTS